MLQTVYCAWPKLKKLRNASLSWKKEASVPSFRDSALKQFSTRTIRGIDWFDEEDIHPRNHLYCSNSSQDTKIKVYHDFPRRLVASAAGIWEPKTLRARPCWAHSELFCLTRSRRWKSENSRWQHEKIQLFCTIRSVNKATCAHFTIPGALRTRDGEASAELYCSTRRPRWKGENRRWRHNKIQLF